MTAKAHRSEIADLRSKYEEMRELRALDAAGSLADPRARMAALAARFPGALREIDALPMEEIEGRLAALAAAAHDPAGVAPWMLTMARFHEALRGALAAKRWLGGRKRVDDEARGAFAAAHIGEPSALAWCGALGEVARPPGGRLLTLVLARVAEETGSTADAVRADVFGSAPDDDDAARSR